MNPQDLIKQARGKFFRIRFYKRDGSIRVMVARTGVAKHVKGIGMKFDPRAKGIQVVFDATKRDYRCFRLDSLLSFDCGNLHWRKA